MKIKIYLFVLILMVSCNNKDNLQGTYQYVDWNVQCSRCLPASCCKSEVTISNQGSWTAKNLTLYFKDEILPINVNTESNKFNFEKTFTDQNNQNLHLSLGGWLYYDTLNIEFYVELISDPLQKQEYKGKYVRI
jgi:hypothetical protein